MSDYTHKVERAQQPGWQQPPAPIVRQCPHLGAAFASLAIDSHPEGHEWVCRCGQVFVVVSNGGRDRRLVRRPEGGQG